MDEVKEKILKDLRKIAQLSDDVHNISVVLESFCTSNKEIEELVADFGCNFSNVFEELNRKIAVLLDRDHQIGHSYFIKTKYEKAGIDELKEIWFNSVMPLLNEYIKENLQKVALKIFREK